MYKLVILTLTLLATGCSTILNGTSQKVTIGSDSYLSSEIEIVQGNKKQLSSIPEWITLYPEDKYVPIKITTTGECIRSKSHILRREVAGAYWLNVFNIVGFFIDDATGAMWQFPDEVILEVSRDHECFMNMATTTK